MSPSLNEVLGPLLGFLVTTATLVFIAVFAKRTHRAQPAPAVEGAGDQPGQEASGAS